MSEGLGAWSRSSCWGLSRHQSGMGWLFAVARGMQEHRASAVAWSLPPIALGHALAIGVVVLIAATGPGGGCRRCTSVSP